MRYTLIDGQGNYGWWTAIRRGDAYTAKRAWRKSAKKFSPIPEKEDGDFVPNFDPTAAKERSCCPRDSESMVEWRLLAGPATRGHGDEHYAAQSGRNHWTPRFY